MTGSEDSSSTRPISVAELLARNGNIGSPPVTGRRRRHRGNADAVTVAELTGEIPIIGHDTREEHPAADLVEPTEPPPAEPAAPEHPADGPASPLRDRRDDYRSRYPSAPSQGVAGHQVASGGVAAEEMSPDFVVGDEDEDQGPIDLADILPADVDEPADEPESLPSYLHSSAGPLFGGQTVADDLARREGGSGLAPAPLTADRDPVPAAYETHETREPQTRTSTFLRGAWIVAQSILAVAFGAGLFIGFNELWKWNNIVALVLSVLVILGLVVGVRVLRKTEDIASTLIAVAVGALVTLGPLALLQSN
jgi:hypothetical protein